MPNMEDLRDRVSSKISTAEEKSQSEIDDGAVKNWYVQKIGRNKRLLAIWKGSLRFPQNNYNV